MFSDVFARLISKRGKLEEGVCTLIRDVINLPHKHQHRKGNVTYQEEESSRLSCVELILNGTYPPPEYQLHLVRNLSCCNKVVVLSCFSC